MPQHPADFTDTDPRVMEVWLEVLRRKTPEERIAIAFDLTEFCAESVGVGNSRQISGGVPS